MHWRKKQHKEKYFKKAKAEGYRARSAYKLLQIQKRFRIMRRGDLVVDLGAAPGSWSQVAAKVVGEQGQVVALDLQPIDPIPGVTILQGDMTDATVQAQMTKALGGHPIDVVLSDAAPATTGIKLHDHAVSMELTRAAFTIARRHLSPKGHLVIKVFEGPDLQDVFKTIKTTFRTARIFAPDASRKGSRETFIVAKNFKPSGEEK
jgi:23S rRNA (uridine2552-2'-O)-methyltransferase